MRNFIGEKQLQNLMIFTFFALGCFALYGQAADKPRIGVIPGGTTRFQEQQSILLENLNTRLIQMNRFEVVNSSDMEASLRARRIPTARMGTLPVQVQEGTRLRANFLFSVMISDLDYERKTRNDPDGRIIVTHLATIQAEIRVIDIARNSYLTSKTITEEGFSSENRGEAIESALQRVASTFVLEIREVFPIDDLVLGEMSVLRVQGFDIGISAGSQSGVDRGTVFYVFEPGEDERFPSPKARLVVFQVNNNNAWAKIIWGNNVQVGDKIKEDTVFHAKSTGYYFGGQSNPSQNVPSPNFSIGLLYSSYVNPLWFRLGINYEWIPEIKPSTSFAFYLGYKIDFLHPSIDIIPFVGLDYKLVNQAIPDTYLQTLRSSYPSMETDASTYATGYLAGLALSWDANNIFQVTLTGEYRYFPAASRWYTYSQKGKFTDDYKVNLDSSQLDLDSWQTQGWRIGVFLSMLTF